MKKKIITFILAICFIIPCAILFAACDNVLSNSEIINDENLEEQNATLYDIVISQQIENGQITASKDRASEGETINIAVQASDGFVLENGSLKYNDAIVYDCQFIMPNENVVITANFVKETFSIYPYHNLYLGTVNPDKTDASAGEIINLTISPLEGYMLEENSITVNGIAIQGTSFVMPNQTAYISAEFVPIVYTVNYHTDELTINSNPDTFNHFSEQISLGAAIKEGYLFKGWFLEDNFQNQVEVINKKGNVNLYPKFEEDPFTEGLEFEKVGYLDPTYYVKSYSGTETDIIIPRTYRNCIVNAILQNAFKDSNITSVKMQNNIVSICENAFKGCVDLTEVDFGTESKLQTIKSHAFHGCQKLESINIPKDVEYIEEYAFESCSKLKDISFEENSQILEIGQNAFERCNNLESIIIPDGIRKIGEYAFAYNNKLANVTISENCYFLKEIGSGAFYGCASLNSIYLPASLETIGDFAFRSCTSLTSITIRNVREIGFNPFAGCTSLERIDCIGSYYYYSPDGSNALIQKVNGNILISGCKNTVIPKNISSLEIGEYAFNGIELKDIIIPRNVVKINQAAFNGCSELAKILIVNDNIESIGSYSFYGCNKLTNIYFTGTQEKWNEAVGSSYIGADLADITYYNLIIYNNYDCLCDAIDRNDIWNWPDLKKNYFIGDSVSYENATLNFYGNTYDLTDKNTDFSTATEGDGLISASIKELDITFKIYQYHVTSIATKVYEEIAKHNKMYAYITDKNHTLTGVEIIENGNYFYTTSINYIFDPTEEPMPAKTQWQIKEDEQNYYTIYLNQRNSGSKNDCYPVIKLHEYINDLKFFQDLSLFTVVNSADYELGNFILADKFNWGETIEVENWLPKTYESVIKSGEEIVTKTAKDFYFDNTASYDIAIAIPEVPDITWREEIKQNYQVIGLKDVYENTNEINEINIEDISIIYNNIEYKDLSILCSPSSTYFVSEDNTLRYSMIVGFNNDQYCCQIILKKKVVI